MNRRNLLLGGAAAAAVTATAVAFKDDLSVIIGGHIKDAKSRQDAAIQLTEGLVTHEGQIRSDDKGQDALHRASGTVNIVYHEEAFAVQLLDNFTSTPGPDYHVYISEDLNIVDEDSFNKSRQWELGKLQRGKGASEYNLPILLDPPKFVSVTIWCKHFGEFIGSANVEFIL